ncbi:MAG: hypothetical protein IJ862_02605 [Selenomonadaceae bacterium]|nr:hypothetical protein [Selenomonadaceae bacterium]
MAVSGIGGSVPIATFRQMNVEANQIGRQATSAGMEEAQENTTVSNFGNETNVGISQFSQNSERIEEYGVESLTKIMEQDDQYEAPTGGATSAFSSIGFQEAYDRSFDQAAQRAASSYSYFNQ